MYVAFLQLTNIQLHEQKQWCVERLDGFSKCFWINLDQKYSRNQILIFWKWKSGVGVYHVNLIASLISVKKTPTVNVLFWYSEDVK